MIHNFLIIKDFTRVSTTSSTIDLILVTDTEKISQHGVLDIGLSDPIFYIGGLNKLYIIFFL